MNLPGRLKLTTLGDVLGSLYRSGASGVLELIEQDGGAAGRAHRVYIDGGLVDAIDSKLPAPKLGELLVREGLLTLEGVRVLVQRLLEAPSKKAGEILLEERLVSRGLLEAALRRQLKNRIDALFTLRDALVRFHVRRPVREPRRSPPLSPREFLHGRPRARQVGDRAAPSGARSRAPELRDAYAVLGLSPGASSDAIRKAFRRLAAEHHPDRHPRASEAERTALARRFSEITVAYHALSR